MKALLVLLIVAILGFNDTQIEYLSPKYCRVSSNATTTGQTLVDITGLTCNLIANARYEFKATMTVSTSAVTTGTGYGVQFTGAGATIEAQITGSSTSTATKTLRINSFNTSAQAWLTTSGQTGGVVIEGEITTGANPGTLSIRHLKVTSGTSTVFAGSVLRILRYQKI